MNYRHRRTGEVISETTYKNLSYSTRQEYSESTSRDVLTSAAVGAVTDNCLLGGIIGGSIAGGVIGDLLSDGELF